MTRTIDQLQYTGKVQPTSEEIRKGVYPYLPSKELVEAVNIAIFLEKRPLLIKGDPGSGKTRLAEAIAFELDLPYETWYVKSTSQARDGLYVYDAVKRLYDAQISRKAFFRRGELGTAKDYIRFGPLGSAFQKSRRSVVLIDEIDKADIDFPNDLLLELDEQRFVIEETGEVIKAKHSPIVIITSNDEKDLPDAFLRRCLFIYIEFPSEERLQEIIKAHFPSPSPKLVERAVKRFYELRAQMQEQKGGLGKKVSTSELLDWFQVLNQFPEDEALALLEGRLPYPEVLLKSWDDHWTYLQREEAQLPSTDSSLTPD